MVNILRDIKRIAGIGGILRDNNGSCITGFVGPCLAISPFISELLAFHFGLKWAINRGYYSLCIETDSEELHALVKDGGSLYVNIHDSGELHALVKGGGSSGSHYVSLARDCRKICQNHPKIEVVHVYREANSCADKLAKEGASMSEQVFIFDDPPDYLWYYITRDNSERATARVVLETQ